MVSESRIRKAYSAPESGDAHLQRLLSIYDVALKACVDRDLKLLERVLDVLNGRLIYPSWMSLAVRLHTHFESARSEARAGRFIVSARILASLRHAWSGCGRVKRAGVRKPVIVNGLSVRRVGVSPQAAV